MTMRSPPIRRGGERITLIWAAARGFHSRHRRLVGVAAAAIATAVVVIALWGQRHDLVTAAKSAPVTTLLAAVGLQLVALLTRTEAWRICVLAAGGTIGRRRLIARRAWAT